MAILKISILISLFFLSNEYISLNQFASTTLNLSNETNYYLDISIFRKPETIKFGFTLKTNSILEYLYIKADFSNSLDFSTVDKERRLSVSTYDPLEKPPLTQSFYYEMPMGTTYKYLLFIIKNPENKQYEIKYFIHNNNPPSTGKGLKCFKNLTINDSEYIILSNEFEDNEYAYLSILLKNESDIISNHYFIDYRLEDYHDDRVFLKNGNRSTPVSSKIKDNILIFYYKLHIKSTKKFTCMNLVKLNQKINTITISHLKGIPTILDKLNKIDTHSPGYTYTDITNSSIGTEFYFKIIIKATLSDDSIDIKFKFSDENFYENYTNMNDISPNIKTKDDNYNYFYKFKKENSANYLLLYYHNRFQLHTIFSEIEKDEYQKIINKRILMATLIPIGGVIVIGVIVTVVVIYVRKKRKSESLINDLVEDKKDNGDSIPLSSAIND